MKKCVEGVAVYDIDIGKNILHVVGLDWSWHRFQVAHALEGFAIQSGLESLYPHSHEGLTAAVVLPTSRIREVRPLQ